MRRLSLLFLVFCSSFLTVPSAQAATTYYVALSGNDTNPGTSAAPFATIQKGLGTAATGDTVQVASGTYTGTGNRDLSFGGKGINLRSANGANATIIDCGGSQSESHRAFVFASNEPTGTTIDGFTVQHGFVSTIDKASAGAILVSNSNLDIRNCIFRENQAVATSGSVFGGTLTVLAFESHTVSVTNCLFTGNSAAFTGSAQGGVVYSQLNGSGELTTNFQNCTFTGNSVSKPSDGVALYNYNTTMNATNCIFYGDTGGSEIGGTPVSVTYSDVQGGYSGTGNIDADPKFVSSTDFQLQKFSPAVNAGTNAGAPAEDLLRVARPKNGIVDMGAYEFAAYNESLVVTTLQDEDNGTSDPDFGSGTSLREAIGYVKVNDGTAPITFAPSLRGTLNLQSTLPTAGRYCYILADATQSITITRGSDQDFNFFNLTPQDDLSIYNLTFANGRNTTSDGGAIRSQGQLIINNCTFRDNSTTGSGGAIYNYHGNLFIYSCTFVGNSASGSGGAISSENGQTGVNNSTLTGNSAGTEGGAMSHSYNNFSVSNCTVVGNTDARGGGGISSYGGNSTFTLLNNSIVAGNNSGTGSTVSGDVFFSNDDSSDTSNSLGSAGYNLIGSGNAIGAFNQYADKTGVTLDQLKLGPLDNYGGPTQTIPLLPGSIAIDTGGSDFTTDQRGVARPQGNSSDIGAFETNPNTDSLVVTTLADEDNNSNDATVGAGRSLREAINTANSRTAGGVITFAPNLTGIITLTSPLPALVKAIEIKGLTATPIAISGSDSYHIFFITSQGVAKISNLTLRNGRTADIGGAIFNTGQLTVENCTFVSNAAYSGGALAAGGTSTQKALVRNCTFSGNSATGFGGAIYSDFGTLEVQNCTISGNSSAGGSGITSLGDVFTFTKVRNSIVAGNSGDDVGLAGGSTNSFQSLGYNLIGQGSGASAFNQSGDILIGAASPGLASFASNGGPTFTRALLPTSPAVNAGDPNFNGSGQTDQRGPGFARVKFGRLDIGAVESDIDSPPVPTITTPGNNQSLATVAFKSISGTASDNLGVTAVQLKLFRTRNGVTQFWNGSAFATAQTLLNATLSAPGAKSTNWTYAVTPALAAALDNGVYSLVVYAKDTAGTSSAALGRNFTLFVDTTAPVPVIVTPANNQVLSSAGFRTLSGTATDNSSVTSVQLKLFRTRGGVTTYWNGSAFTTTAVQFPATLATPGAASTTWSYPVSSALLAVLDNGAYGLVAYGKDAAGNTSAAVGRNFSIDNVLPAVVVLAPTQNQSLPLQSFASITGSATDNSGIGQVQIKLFRTRGGVTTFWNGSAFTSQDVRVTATLSSPNATSTNWTYAVSPALRAALDSGPYLLTAYAKDVADNQSAAVGRNFSLYSDTSAPTVAFTTPNQNQPLPAIALTSIAGTASDDTGVTGVQFKLFRSRGGVIQYWNGSAFTTTVALLNATVANPGATNTNWNYEVPAALRNALDVGTYNLVAYSKDAANNQSAGVGRTFSITITSGGLQTPPPSASGQSF